jgi:hypothetical protein
MCSHAENFHDFFVCGDLVHEAVVDIEAPDVRSGQFADHFFVGGGFRNGSSARMESRFSVLGLRPEREIFLASIWVCLV